MSQQNLLGIYNSIIRPSAEYCSVVYHSLIPKYLSDKLEAFQKQAMKIVYNYDVDYNQLVDDGKIESLHQRRVDACLKFANKASRSPRYGGWFKQNPETMRNARPTTRKKYFEPLCKTERMRNNPLNYMTRLLNEQESV